MTPIEFAHQLMALKNWREQNTLVKAHFLGKMSTLPASSTFSTRAISDLLLPPAEVLGKEADKAVRARLYKCLRRLAEWDLSQYATKSTEPVKWYGLDAHPLTWVTRPDASKPQAMTSSELLSRLAMVDVDLLELDPFAPECLPAIKDLVRDARHFVQVGLKANAA